MWKTDPNDSSLGLAVWQDDHGSWSIDARDSSGIRAIQADLLATAQADGPVEWFRLKPVDQPALPPIAEQFVRGDELHLSFPQGDALYGLRLAIQPVRSINEYLVIETTISIQTSLLDTHPKLDIAVAGDQVRTMNPGDLPTESGSPPVSIASTPAATVAVLLGPHDAPFTTNRSVSDGVHLRLFGDFLEKGVIRKARPWFVIDRGRKISDSTIRGIWERLSASPLPLTP
jgi:hypothetical protein